MLNHFLKLVSIEPSDQGPESSVPEHEVERGQLPRDLEDSQTDNTKKLSSGAPNEAVARMEAAMSKIEELEN